jgi:hypothetical protein
MVAALPSGEFSLPRLSKLPDWMVRTVTAHTVVFEACRNRRVWIKEVPSVDQNWHTHEVVHTREIHFPKLAPFRQ